LVKNGEEEIAKILDFGVAKQLNSDELVDLAAGEGTIMGTPQFMSPEQAHGLTDVDHRADLWALGVIVYRALTGKLPFHAPTPTEVIVQVCTVAPIPVSVRAPDLPRELDDFFARALAKNRQHRFQSAREMAMAFSRISPVNFTTLSMPDPGPAIEQALRRAAEDDDAETIAVDALSAAALVDLETRIHQSAHPLPLPAPRPPPPSRRGPPKLPPRRSKPPDTLRSPASSPLALSPSAAPPPTDSAPDIPTPARGLPPHAAALAAAVATPPSSAPVAAAGLFDAGPAEPGSYTPHGVTRAATEPSDPGRDDLELDALVPTSSRPTWLLALAAVLVGVAMAIVGSVVLRDEASQASTPPAETDTSVDETPATPPPNDPAEPNQDERADPPDSDEPDEAALDGGEAAAEPSADTAADSRKPPRPWPRGGRMVAPPPPLQPAPAPAPEPPPPAPAPTPKPAGGDDPFADRL
jgi:hypothetical protein